MERNINGSKFVPATDAQRERFVNDVIPPSNLKSAPTGANGSRSQKPTDQTRGSRDVPADVFVRYPWEWREVAKLAEAELRELFDLTRTFLGGVPVAQ